MQQIHCASVDQVEHTEREYGKWMLSQECVVWRQWATNHPGGEELLKQFDKDLQEAYNAGEYPNLPQGQPSPVWNPLGFCN